MKWTEDPKDFKYFSELIRLLGSLKETGYPLPRYLDPIQIEGGVVILQERVAGSWNDAVDADLVGRVFELNDLQASFGAGSDDWTKYIRMTLIEGADGYCLHEPLRQHSESTHRILNWIEDTGSSVKRLPSNDIVHLDFHHRNLLREDDKVTVVDWEGAREGDRVFDLVTFFFGLTHAQVRPEIADSVWTQVAKLGRVQDIRAYVAHMALRRLDWTIRHHPDEIQTLVEFVDSTIQRMN
jgi:hypothetical protein